MKITKRELKKLVKSMVEEGKHMSGMDKVQYDKHKGYISELTDYNNHIEAYSYIAEEILDNEKLTKIFEAIKVIQRAEGGVDSELNALTNKYYEELKTELFKLGELGEKIYQLT